MKPNDFVAFLLRSPLHPILGNTMLITVIGRKSGRRISTPVNHVRCGNELWVLTSRNRTWWRNVGEGTPVAIHLDGRDLRAVADLVLEPQAVADQLLEYARKLPAAASALGLRSPATAAVTAARLSAERLFVRIRMESPPVPEGLPLA